MNFFQYQIVVYNINVSKTFMMVIFDHRGQQGKGARGHSSRPHVLIHKSGISSNKFCASLEGLEHLLETATIPDGVASSGVASRGGEEVDAAEVADGVVSAEGGAMRSARGSPSSGGGGGGTNLERSRDVHGPSVGKPTSRGWMRMWPWGERAIMSGAAAAPPGTAPGTDAPS
jgi:hypothetical protein